MQAYQAYGSKKKIYLTIQRLKDIKINKHTCSHIYSDSQTSLTQFNKLFSFADSKFKTCGLVYWLKNFQADYGPEAMLKIFTEKLKGFSS